MKREQKGVKRYEKGAKRNTQIIDFNPKSMYDTEHRRFQPSFQGGASGGYPGHHPVRFITDGGAESQLLHNQNHAEKTCSPMV